ncbi:hypothetical protein T484DRAFT_1842663 [Baffinella frigidus]|nr:hypothetical protein T484DRAFT_1842663 [Cryptophyta sp. CCMP2293]
MVASNKVSHVAANVASPKMRQQKSMFKRQLPRARVATCEITPSVLTDDHGPKGEDRDGCCSPDGRDFPFPEGRDFPFFLPPAVKEEGQQQQFQQQQHQQHPRADDSCAARRGRTLPSLELYSGQEGGATAGWAPGLNPVTGCPMEIEAWHGGSAGEGGGGAQREGGTRSWELSRFQGNAVGPGGGEQMGAYGQRCGALQECDSYG